MCMKWEERKDQVQHPGEHKYVWGYKAKRKAKVIEDLRLMRKEIINSNRYHQGFNALAWP
jgi:hypothetical protein